MPEESRYEVLWKLFKSLGKTRKVEIHQKPTVIEWEGKRREITSPSVVIYEVGKEPTVVPLDDLTLTFKVVPRKIRTPARIERGRVVEWKTKEKPLEPEDLIKYGYHMAFSYTKNNLDTIVVTPRIPPEEKPKCELTPQGLTCVLEVS